MSRRPALLVACFCVLVAIYGCATGRTFMQLRDERDALVALDGTLTRLGRFPSAEVMSPGVRLVTFLARHPSSDPPRRDTIRGADGVSRWLEQWYARQVPDLDLTFSPSQISLCSGVAVQRGVFRYRPGDARSEIRTESYASRWIPTETGDWMLDGLWLGTDRTSASAPIATACRSLAQENWALRRFTLRGEALVAGRPPTGGVEDQMVAAGWTDHNRGDAGYPRLAEDGVGLAAAVGYRLTPRWTLEGLYIRSGVTQVRGRVGAAMTPQTAEPTLRIRDEMVAVLAVANFGPASLGIGPTRSQVRLAWLESLDNAIADPVASTQGRFGAVAEGRLTAPLITRLRPYVAFRYVWFESGSAPPFLGQEGLEVNMTRMGAGVGVVVSF